MEQEKTELIPRILDKETHLKFSYPTTAQNEHDCNSILNTIF